MGNSPQNRQFYLTYKMRILLLVTGVFLFLLGVTFPLLDAFNIVHVSNAWFNVISIFLAALGIVAGFGQWFYPLGTPLPVTDKKREAFRQQIERDLNKRLNKGALVVFTTDSNVALDIHLIPQRLWKVPSSTNNKPNPTRQEIVKRHKIGTGYVCAAIFRDLDPDDYLVWTDINQPSSVPVFSNEATTVDQL